MPTHRLIRLPFCCPIGPVFGSCHFALPIWVLPSRIKIGSHDTQGCVGAFWHGQDAKKSLHNIASFVTEINMGGRNKPPTQINPEKPVCCVFVCSFGQICMVNLWKDMLKSPVRLRLGLMVFSICLWKIPQHQYFLSLETPGH